MSVKRIVGVSVLLVVLLAASGCSMLPSLPGTADDEPETAPVLVQSDRRVVTAEAVIEPADWSQVAYAVGGTVTEVLVNEGDLVRVDQVLVRLDSVHQEASVAQAQAVLQKAQARLDELKAGARQEEIDVALAAVASAKVQLVRLQEGLRPEEIAPSEAALAVAEASLQKVHEGASEDMLIAARADLANALALQQQAQAAYDLVRGQPHVGALPQSLQLEQATNAVIAAQAFLDELQSGASAADIAIASAQILQAQAQIDMLELPARPSDIAATNAEILRAEAQLSLIEAPLRPETIAGTKADVAAAAVALQQAELARADMELRSPVSGTATDVRLQVGDQVAPGVPVLVLATLDAFTVRTIDLKELDVARVQVGQPVAISVDALPEHEFTGTVQEIGLQAGNYHGDVVYDVTIKLEKSDGWELLRWGMTAVARIKVE